MPIYEFECSKCKNIFEDWCKSVADGDKEHFCPACDAPATRIISHTSFALKGGGWYATEYGTMKNKSEGSATSKESTSSTDSSTTKDTPKSDASPSKVETSTPKENKSSSVSSTAS